MPKTVAESIQAPDVTRFSRTIEIPPECLISNPEEDARHYQPGELAELAASLADPKIGQLQDILIRRGEHGEPVITDGRRRVSAMIYYNSQVDAGVESPPKLRARCTVADCDSLTALVRAVVANRERLNPTAIDDAYSAQKLLDAGKSREEVCRIFRHSDSWLSRSLALRSLPSSLQERIHKGEISAWAGYELSQMTEGERRRMLADFEASGERITAEAIDYWRRLHPHNHVAALPQSVDPADGQPGLETGTQTEAETSVETSTETDVGASAPEPELEPEPPAVEEKFRRRNASEQPRKKAGRPRTADTRKPRLPGSKSQKKQAKPKPLDLARVRLWFETHAGDEDAMRELCQWAGKWIAGEVTDDKFEQCMRVACGLAG